MSISMRDLTEEELVKAIVSSDVFKRSMNQVHHMDTTLGRHLIDVKDCALKMSESLEKIGIKTDRRAVIVSSLCHDLGMVGRYEIYKNNYECLRSHPRDSVDATANLVEDIDATTKGAILSHMWPLSKHRPRSVEGWILVAADKQSTFEGTMQHFVDVLKLKLNYA